MSQWPEVKPPAEVTIELDDIEKQWYGKLKIYYFHDFSSCGYYRCWLPSVYLRSSTMAKVKTSYEEESQIERDVLISPQVRLSPSYMMMKKQKVLDAIDWADIVVLQRMAEIEGVRMIDLIQSKGKPVVHEVDDVCELVPQGNPSYWYWRDEERIRRHGECFKKADLVTCTNPRAARFYKERYGTPVAILPNQIDYGSSRWRDINYDKGPGVTIGWMGSESHVVELEVLSKVVPWLLETYPEARFEFLGFLPEWATGLPRTVHKQTDILGVPREMANWDIGLASISDIPFNTVGKSDVKFLEYSAAFTATVASNLETYSSSIVSGENGLLARWDDPDEWKGKIKKLIENPEMRRRFVLQAHNYVRAERSMQQNIAKWFKVYLGLHTRGRVSGVEII